MAWALALSLWTGGLLRAEREPVPVVVSEAKTTQFVDVVEALGTLRANESVDLTANVTETAIKIHFDDGDRVEEGKLLVEMLSTQEEALLLEARSTLNEAKIQYDRVNKLSKTGAIPTSRIRGKMSRKQLVFSSEIQKVCTTADYSASFPLAVIRGRG